MALNLLTFFARNKIFYFRIESCTFEMEIPIIYEEKVKKILGVLQINDHSAPFCKLLSQLKFSAKHKTFCKSLIRPFRKPKISAI